MPTKPDCKVRPSPNERVSIERIAAEHRARWPKPFDHGPRAVDVIRGDRDARADPRDTSR